MEEDNKELLIEELLVDAELYNLRNELEMEVIKILSNASNTYTKLEATQIAYSEWIK